MTFDGIRGSARGAAAAVAGETQTAQACLRKAIFGTFGGAVQFSFRAVLVVIC